MAELLMLMRMRRKSPPRRGVDAMGRLRRNRQYMLSLFVCAERKLLVLVLVLIISHHHSHSNTIPDSKRAIRRIQPSRIRSLGTPVIIVGIAHLTTKTHHPHRSFLLVMPLRMGMCVRVIMFTSARARRPTRYVLRLTLLNVLAPKAHPDADANTTNHS